MSDSESPQIVPYDRRAFPRLPASAIPGLTAVTARSALKLLDISAGGALIETPTRWQPGERESFLLHADKSIKIAGWVIRAEVTRLTPCLHYRSAIQFVAPVALRALVAKVIELHPSGQWSNRFARLAQKIPSVQAIRISSSLTADGRTESVYFTVPDSLHGERRLLQVFLVPHRTLTSEEFIQLKMLTHAASGLPDLHITLR